MQTIAALSFVVLTLNALAEEGLKFRSTGANGALPARYRVSVALHPGDEIGTISRRLATQYGGRLEPYAEIGFVGFVVMTTEARARSMSSDARVVLVEELEPESEPTVAEPSTPAPAERITAEAVRRPKEIATEAITGFGTYTYDGSGNITSIGDGTGKDTFVYDELGRLTEVTLRDAACLYFDTGEPNDPSPDVCRTQKFTYDQYGNIRLIEHAATASVTKPGVDEDTNQINENGSGVNVLGIYDSRGNLTAYTSGSFTYDGLDMMTQANVGSTNRVYLYSASDERIATINSGAINGTEWTIRDPRGRVLRRLAEANGMFEWSSDYIYRDGQLLATAVPGSEKVRHFHVDHLGTPRLVTGNGGARIAHHQYLPFGAELPTSMGDLEKAKFTGHERDAATLDYMHARYYDPFMGRFFSVDPGKDWDLRMPQSWNMYSYVRNKPMNASDPSGRWTFSFGVSFGGSTIGWNVSTKYAIAVDDHLNVAIVRSRAGGGGAIATLGQGSVDLAAEWSPKNDTVHDMADTTLQVGGGGRIFMGGSMEMGFDSEGPNSVTVSGGFGGGAEGHAVLEHSVILGSISGTEIRAAVTDSARMINDALVVALKAVVPEPEQVEEDRPIEDDYDEWEYQP